MNFDTNKYRLKYVDGKRPRTEAFLRSKAFEVWTNSLKGEAKTRVLKFDGKEISKEHRRAFAECAKLWNNLTEFENAVIQRRRKSKKTTM